MMNVAVAHIEELCGIRGRRVKTAGSSVPAALALRLGVGVTDIQTQNLNSLLN